MSRGARLRAVLAVLALLLTACSGVPSRSNPEVVQTVGEQATGTSSVSPPPPGANPYQIVSQFLNLNASSDAFHLAASTYLTTEEKNHWSGSSGTSGTTVIDQEQISTPTKQNQITVTGDLVGTIDGATGIFTPAAGPKDVTFTLRDVQGQGWRIDNITPNGLLITRTQFIADYVQRYLYFFDQAEKHLVPDPRYTSLQDPAQLASWLMTQLATGPNPDLTQAVINELPAQVGTNKVTATVGSVLKVEIPGSSQLGSRTERMAEQVATTLQSQFGDSPIEVTDGGRPVRIPQLQNSVFSVGSFPTVTAPAISTPRLYYVDADNGHVIDTSTSRPVPGPIGSGYQFASIGLGSLSSDVSDNHLLAAGTVGAPGQQQLYVGTSAGLRQVAGVSGALTRPTWAPLRDEVWVASGPKLYWATSASKVASPVEISAGSGSTLADIVAVRLSPDGARVALVAGPSGQGQLWIGSVVRSTTPKGPQVQVTGLKSISPPGVSIADVAWNGELILLAIGKDSAGNHNVYETSLDGSQWRSSGGLSNLPPVPDSITVADNEVAVVSVNSTVWQQSGESWVSLSPGESSLTHGTNPVYVE